MKEKMITRTIISTNYSIMSVNVNKGTVETVEITLSGNRDDEKVLKYCNEMWQNAVNNCGMDDLHKAVAVTSAEEVETLYGMPESTFMKYAVVLPPRGTKKESEEE